MLFEGQVTFSADIKVIYKIWERKIRNTYSVRFYIRHYLKLNAVLEYIALTGHTVAVLKKELRNTHKVVKDRPTGICEGVRGSNVLI